MLKQKPWAFCYWIFFLAFEALNQNEANLPPDTQFNSLVDY